MLDGFETAMLVTRTPEGVLRSRPLSIARKRGDELFDALASGDVLGFGRLQPSLSGQPVALRPPRGGRELLSQPGDLGGQAFDFLARRRQLPGTRRHGVEDTPSGRPRRLRHPRQ